MIKKKLFGNIFQRLITKANKIGLNEAFKLACFSEFSFSYFNVYEFLSSYKSTKHVS